MRVRLESKANQDLRGDSRDIKERFVDVCSLKNAQAVCNNFIAGCGLGGGNWTGGQVFDNGIQVAEISYNGRIWDMNRNEIKD